MWALFFWEGTMAMLLPFRPFSLEILAAMKPMQKPNQSAQKRDPHPSSSGSSRVLGACTFFVRHPTDTWNCGQHLPNMRKCEDLCWSPRTSGFQGTNNFKNAASWGSCSENPQFELLSILERWICSILCIGNCLANDHFAMRWFRGIGGLGRRPWRPSTGQNWSK